MKKVISDAVRAITDEARVAAWHEVLAQFEEWEDYSKLHSKEKNRNFNPDYVGYQLCEITIGDDDKRHARITLEEVSEGEHHDEHLRELQSVLRIFHCKKCNTDRVAGWLCCHRYRS